MREAYTESLHELSEQVIELGQMITKAVNDTWISLSSLDNNLASKIYHDDDRIDEIVRNCIQQDLTISVLQSPVAADWRYLMATLRILTDLERIADHCADINNYIFRLNKEKIVDPPSGMEEMYEVMSSMVTDVIDLYNKQDADSTEEVAVIKDKDDIVDTAFTNNIEEISKKMADEPAHIHQYIIYVLIIKYIERMADHASNIADWVLYKNHNMLR